MRIAIYSAASLLLMAFSFLVFRVIVRRDYSKKGRTTLFSIILETLVFALHANFSYFFIPATWPNLLYFPNDLLHQVIGLFLIGFGILITLAAMISLGYKMLFGQGSDEIKCSGFYRYSRNPQLVAYGAAIIGLALLWPSWYSLIWIILYGIIAHMMIITEEEFLHRVHGADYDKYCKQVSRYITLNFSRGK
jgi:protein-S-isoprenylcysteine O-methyltransferase Ste14